MSREKRSRKSRTKKFYGYFEGTLSIFVNTVLFGLKYWAGFTTGSIAIVADAWHTLSDSLTSIIVIVSFKISSTRPDKKHPFGHGRAELIASIIIGSFLAIIGFNFFVESIQRFRGHQPASFNNLAIIIFAISIVLKEAIAQYSIRIGKKIDSRSLVADGWHHRSDSIASFLILIGILVGRYIWWIDSVMGFAVSILIFYAAFNILRGSTSPLLGEEPDDEFKSVLKNLLSELELKKASIHHLHMHKYGEHTEITFHLQLPHTMNLLDAHAIADNLENTIRKKMNVEPTIHIDPV
jgi:cation diffusion facilitator family transporter